MISFSFDMMGWAKCPRSQYALNAVIDGAKQDERLREILEGLIANGIATSEGRLLQCYANGAWVKT
jgi:hypothetical protein